MVVNDGVGVGGVVVDMVIVDVDVDADGDVDVDVTNGFGSLDVVGGRTGATMIGMDGIEFIHDVDVNGDVDGDGDVGTECVLM